MRHVHIHFLRHSPSFLILRSIQLYLLLPTNLPFVRLMFYYVLCLPGDSPPSILLFIRLLITVYFHSLAITSGPHAASYPTTFVVITLHLLLVAHPSLLTSCCIVPHRHLTSIVSFLLVSPPVPPYHIHILSFVAVAMPNTIPAGSIPMPQVGSRVFYWDVNSQIKIGTVVGTARMTDMTMVVDIKVDGGSIVALPVSSVSCVT